MRKILDRKHAGTRKESLNPFWLQEKFIRNGEPTEAAIRVLVEKLGCPDQADRGPLPVTGR